MVHIVVAFLKQLENEGNHYYKFKNISLLESMFDGSWFAISTIFTIINLVVFQYAIINDQ